MLKSIRYRYLSPIALYTSRRFQWNKRNEYGSQSFTQMETFYHSHIPFLSSFIFRSNHFIYLVHYANHFIVPLVHSNSSSVYTSRRRRLVVVSHNMDAFDAFAVIFVRFVASFFFLLILRFEWGKDSLSVAEFGTRKIEESDRKCARKRKREQTERATKGKKIEKLLSHPLQSRIRNNIPENVGKSSISIATSQLFLIFNFIRFN